MKLIDFLQANAMTDAAFGEKAGLSQSQVSRLKRDKSKPSWEAVKRIAKATKGAVTAADFADKPVRRERKQVAA